MSLAAALSHARAGRDRFVEELKTFVRFPSVSAQPRHAGDVVRCATWLAGHLKRLGMEGVRVVPTRRHPLVYAEWKHRPDRPTALIYGHYDVQPADPLDQWRSPPFQPTVRGENLYGRGACDDKGQMFAHVKALESFLRTSGKLPLNVVCLFEGEEEIGSPNLSGFIERNRRALASDVAVVSDTRMLAPDRPAITYGLRGGLGLKLEVMGPRNDLHSGNFGGAILNPIQALCEILAKLHDADGRIAIPGFYDEVRTVEPEERARGRQVGPPDERILHNARVERGWGEAGFSLHERTTIRPALTINGIEGGYRGPGGKAVIPARASAKISFRLVPDQNPKRIEHLVRRQIARLTPPEVRSRVRTLLHARPALIDPNHPAMHAAAFAYRKGFGAAPVFLRSGGTIPVVNTFQQLLGIPTVLMGFALPDDRIHAPNEKFHLPNFDRGIETGLWMLAALGSPVEARSGARTAAISSNRTATAPGVARRHNP